MATRAITFKEVKKDREQAEAVEVWHKIGDITGAGHLPASDEATIDLTDVSDAKRGQIDRLLAKEDEVVIDEKKRGVK